MSPERQPTTLPPRLSQLPKLNTRPDLANPHIGVAGRPSSVEEERIEVQCDRSVAKQVIAALKQAHPYEEVMINITALFDEDQL